MLRIRIEQLLAGRSLSRSEASGLMAQIMDGELTDVQIAGLLVAMRAKGPTVDEIAGFAWTMRSRAVHVTPTRECLVDTCGTGGDGANTFNISTAAALVAAGAGVNVAKHGNRAVSSQSGSADVLEALGVPNVPADRVAGVIDNAGIGFMFAPSHHPAMRHAVAARRELGVRTVFNLLGPLTNPAGVTRQLVGVSDGSMCETIANVLGELGSEKVYVVHGKDGSDEVSVTGDTMVTVLDDGKLRSFTFVPDSVGITPHSADALVGGSARDNAAIIEDVLSGNSGAARDAVAVNAGFVICAAGVRETIADGVAAAAEAIDSGAARRSLEKLRRASLAATKMDGNDQ